MSEIEIFKLGRKFEILSKTSGSRHHPAIVSTIRTSDEHQLRDSLRRTP